MTTQNIRGSRAGTTVRQPEPPGPGERAQTPREIEGPYFRLGAPKRSNLLEPGDKPELVLSGRVLNPVGTPIPGAYEPREAKHFHVKVQGVSSPITTQLYVEGEAGNEADHYYSSDLLIH